MTCRGLDICESYDSVQGLSRNEMHFFMHFRYPWSSSWTEKGQTVAEIPVRNNYFSKEKNTSHEKKKKAEIIL